MFTLFCTQNKTKKYWKCDPLTIENTTPPAIASVIQPLFTFILILIFKHQNSAYISPLIALKTQRDFLVAVQLPHSYICKLPHLNHALDIVMLLVSLMLKSNLKVFRDFQISSTIHLKSSHSFGSASVKITITFTQVF